MDELIHDLHFLGPSWAACLYHRETCFELNYFFITHGDLPRIELCFFENNFLQVKQTSSDNEVISSSGYR
jgi:hypothetical protein